MGLSRASALISQPGKFSASRSGPCSLLAGYADADGAVNLGNTKELSAPTNGTVVSGAAKASAERERCQNLNHNKHNRSGAANGAPSGTSVAT
jgi:hypothetical protein